MPRIPLSGVRISWLTVARKRDLATLAASARWSASSRERADSIRSVMSEPARSHCVRPPTPVTRVSMKENQRGMPSTGRTCISTRVTPSGCCWRTPCSRISSSGRRAEQRQGLHTEETPESVIGECDAALRVPLDDDVGGRLNEGAVALLAFRDPPDAILKPLDLGRVRGRLPPRAGSRVNRSDGHQRDQDENDLRRDHRPLRPEAWADRRRPGHGAAGHRCPPSRARSIPVPRIPP